MQRFCSIFRQLLQLFPSEHSLDFAMNQAQLKINRTRTPDRNQWRATRASS
jgi:hypothetical protein